MSVINQSTARQFLEKQGLMNEDVVAARVDGNVTDLHTFLSEGNHSVEPIKITSEDALAVIRHSSAHVMADAVQKLFPGTRVAFGPATEQGFYYDIDRSDGTFSEDDLRRIEQKMEEVIAQDFPFRREEVTKEDARKILESKRETFKLEHLDRLEGPIFLYRHGDWVDLCEGPHVPSTRFLKAFRLTTVAGAYWRGDERNPMLQRIYGTAFGSKKDLDEYLKRLEESKLRDHRKLGKELHLFAFHPLAPASPFFLPRGAKLYQGLIDYIRGLYRRYGYEEVVTPQVFDVEMFKISGHFEMYRNNMFFAATSEDMAKAAGKIVEDKHASREKIEEQILHSMRFGVKSMNCPGHALLFGTTRRSYRELPWRMADFGRLHRFERSGVVQGLTRVRTFAQDDAHIFCTMDQLQSEIGQFIALVYDVYQDLAFSDVRVVLATRPDKRLGDDSLWDKAETALAEAIKAKGLPYEVAEGEGAFYGPKIEFHLKDALGRPWQLGTIQADFNMAERFDLTYVGEDNTQHRPVVLHRAILGSVERFLAILIEHSAGAFPCWLAPEQVRLLTVSEKFNEYAESVRKQLEESGIRCNVDLSAEKLGAKIRSGRLMRIPYLAVIGQKEVEAQGASVRSRDQDADMGLLTIKDFIERVRAESRPPSERASS